jgi:hypothetical protein
MCSVDLEEKMASKNRTAEKLTGLPFHNAADLKAAQQALLLAAWTRLESAKALYDLTQREEYVFWREEFAQGLACSYDGNEQVLVRVFSDSPGIKISINQELAATLPTSEAILGVLVRAMSESFTTTYYQAKGILPADPVRVDAPERGAA